MIVIVILLVQTINTVSYRKTDTFISALFGHTQFAYAYIALTIGIFILAKKQD